MAYTEADSFTLQTRVEAIIRHGPFTASTNVTDQQVRDRMALDAGEVSAVLRRHGHDGTPATVKAGTSADELMLLALCDSGNAFRSAAYVLRMVVRDAKAEVYDAYHEAADRILGNSAKGIVGKLAELLGNTVGSGGVSVNTDIEIERDDLLHVSTVRF